MGAVGWLPCRCRSLPGAPHLCVYHLLDCHSSPVHQFLSQLPTDTHQKILSFSRTISASPIACNRPVPTWLSYTLYVPACDPVSADPCYDRFVNSSGLFLVPHQETGSRFFVCSSSFCHLKSTHYHLTSNADSGHSDVQHSFDDFLNEEDDQDGVPTLVLS